MNTFVVIFGLFLYFLVGLSKASRPGSVVLSPKILSGVQDTTKRLDVSPTSLEKPQQKKDHLYRVHLKIDIHKKLFQGKVDIKFNPTEGLEILTVDSAYSFSKEDVRVIAVDEMDQSNDEFKFGTLGKKKGKFLVNQFSNKAVKRIVFNSTKKQAEIHLTSGLAAKEYMLTIFYSGFMTTETFVWLYEEHENPYNDSHRLEKRMYRTAISNLFEKGIHNLIPLYREVGSDHVRVTFQVTTEVQARTCLTATNTENIHTKEVDGVRLDLFQETSKMLPNLFKIVITSLVEGNFDIKNNGGNGTLEKLHIYSGNVSDLPRDDNMYMKSVVEIVNRLDTHFQKFYPLIKLSVIISSDKEIERKLKENPYLQKSEGILIISGRSDEYGIYKSLCEVIMFQRIINKLGNYRDYWLIESISRYVAHAIMSEAITFRKLIEQEIFDSVSSIIDDSTRQRRLLKADLPVYLLSLEVKFNRGLSIMNMLADISQGLLTHTLYILVFQCDVVNLRNFQNTYMAEMDTFRVQLVQDDVNKIDGWVMYDMLPLLTVTSNVESSTVQITQLNDGRPGQNLPILTTAIRIHYYRKEIQQYSEGFEILGVNDCDLTFKEPNLEMYTLKRTPVPFNVIYDERNWEAIAAFVHNAYFFTEEDAAFLMMEMTNIIVENVLGNNKERNVRMVTAFTLLLRLPSTDYGYMMWASFKKAVEKLSPYFKNTDLEILFKNRILEQILPNMYNTIVRGTFSLEESDEQKKIKKIMIQIGSMVGLTSHINLTKGILTIWRKGNFENIYSSNSGVHPEVINDVLGTAIQLTGSEELEKIVTVVGMRYSDGDSADVSVLEPLKHGTNNVAPNYLCDLIEAMLKENSDNRKNQRSSGKDLIRRNNEKINEIFKYLMTGSDASYNYGKVILNKILAECNLYLDNPGLTEKLLCTFFTHVRTTFDYVWFLQMGEVQRFVSARGAPPPALPLKLQYPIIEAQDRLKWRDHETTFKKAIKEIPERSINTTAN